MSEKWLQLNRQDLEIQSRGIRAKPGEPTTEQALWVLSKAQINWQGKSAQLLIEDLQWADEVWGMTQEHLDVATQVGTGLPQDSRPCYQLLAGKDELVDPLNCGLGRYQALFDTLEILLAKRLAAI